MKNLLSMFCLAIAASVFAQDGTLDTTFNVGTGFDYEVVSTAIQPDGKIIVGGYFTEFNGTNRNHIARLNTNGSLDTTFNPSGTGFNSDVYSIAIQSDGKIIVGGYFTEFNGVSRNRIARLNIDGTLDTTFNPGTGFNEDVVSPIIQAGEKIIVGGRFTSFNGTNRNRIACLNTDGTLDASFNPGTGFNNWIIYSTAIQSDGKIIVGGDFTEFNGTTRNYIVRLNTNGTLDTTFNIGTGFNNLVYSIAIQSDGKIITGGFFNQFNGTIRNRIARLNIDGTLDLTFNPSIGFNDWVYFTAIQADSKIIVGGDFTEFNGTGRNYIARLNTNGTLDISFNSAGVGFNARIRSLAIQSDGKIIAGGLFTAFDGVGRSRIARLNGTAIVGISENTPTAAFTFDVYPNPTNAMVSVSLSDALLGQKILLLNTIGQVLETKNITATTMSYDLANLANGIYFIQVQTNKGIITKKVVKH
jgi:uncharacterized delta-60 repeat protein